MQKKKNRQGVRLNLCGVPNKNIIDCYSPGQVVKAREYQQEKEALAAAEEEAKYQRKVQRAANALHRKQEKAEKDRLNAIKAVEKDAVNAAKQLTMDLATANKPVRKAPAKKRATTTNTTKTVSKTVPIRQKLAPKVRPKAKKIPQQDLVVESGGVGAAGVAIAKTASRTISLP